LTDVIHVIHRQVTTIIQRGCSPPWRTNRQRGRMRTSHRQRTWFGVAKFNLTRHASRVTSHAFLAPHVLVFSSVSLSMSSLSPLIIAANTSLVFAQRSANYSSPPPAISHCCSSLPLHPIFLAATQLLSSQQPLHSSRSQPGHVYEMRTTGRATEVAGIWI
jgi:hypothetical protein